MRRLIIILLLALTIFQLSVVDARVNADDNVESSEVTYVVYDESFNRLFERNELNIGDGYMSPERKYYEVTYIDEELKYGIAKFVRIVELPDVKISHAPKPISIDRRVICLYMTHNDESYVPTDGVDSVYGNGGIKDVALAFKKMLEQRFVDVYFDDTLHIPHDTKAYNRSKVTADKLYSKYEPDAIFDIHRDATSRKFYVANVDGEERGRVRIVLGQSNPNFALNEEFALYLVAVANEMYPWLITDIYYGKGHYNQSIDAKAILFEMGTYLIEKELVVGSMDELADVVTTALYNTTVNEESGDLTINGIVDGENITIKEHIDEKQSTKVNVLALFLALFIMAGISAIATCVFVLNLRKIKDNYSRNLYYENFDR